MYIAKSGDIFELTTDDFDARPLPSVKLLEMQWFLARVTGMAYTDDKDMLSDGSMSDPEYCVYCA